MNNIMKDIINRSKECFKKQIDPDTTEFECFFHYTDEKIFEAGFVKGYELAKEKLYSIDDIHKIIKYMNDNYSKIEDELSFPYEDKGLQLPEDFFDKAYDTCLNRAIDNIREL
jgi:hypothetical protein